jgi:hypothetical protein
VGQAEDDVFTCAQRERPGGRRAVDDQLDRARERQDVGPSAHHHAARDGREQRLDQAVLGPRRELDPHFGPACRALQGPDEHAGGVRAERMRVVSGAAGQRVDDDEGARRGGPGGLQHHRQVDVAATHVGRASVGRTAKWPRPGEQAPNTEGASNRGAQNQSTEPSRLTSAAVWRSDSRA